MNFGQPFANNPHRPLRQHRRAWKPMMKHSLRLRTRFSAIFISILAIISAHETVAQSSNICGQLENHYGPFDYRGRQGNKKLVEDNHFTNGVENLTQRKTGPFGGDLNYTLHVFPNHYRALLTMERLVAKEKNDQPEGAEFPIECYYDRALRFVPNDHVVRLLYALFLNKRNRSQEAIKQMDYVTETTLENPIAQLNVGRMYLDMKEYDKALKRAHHLMSMGFDRAELRDGLTAAGRWQDPPPDEPASGASR